MVEAKQTSWLDVQRWRIGLVYCDRTVPSVKGAESWHMLGMNWKLYGSQAFDLVLTTNMNWYGSNVNISKCHAPFITALFITLRNRSMIPRISSVTSWVTSRTWRVPIQKRSSVSSVISITLITANLSLNLDWCSSSKMLLTVNEYSINFSRIMLIYLRLEHHYPPLKQNIGLCLPIASWGHTTLSSDEKKTGRKTTYFPNIRDQHIANL